MYILTLTLPRAETTDTLLLFVSDSRSTLEELVLSLWEEEEYVSYCYYYDIDTAKMRAQEYVNNLAITFVPVLK